MQTIPRKPDLSTPRGQMGVSGFRFAGLFDVGFYAGDQSVARKVSGDPSRHAAVERRFGGAVAAEVGHCCPIRWSSTPSKVAGPCHAVGRGSRTAAAGGRVGERSNGQGPGAGCAVAARNVGPQGANGWVSPTFVAAVTGLVRPGGENHRCVQQGRHDASGVMGFAQ